MPNRSPTGTGVAFLVNPETILAGELARLKWEVEGIREVYLDGQEVANQETRVTEPGATRTFTLRVVLADGGTQSVTVTVAVEKSALPQPDVSRPPTVRLEAENIARLKRYPRPPQDNGIGLHFHVDLTDFWIEKTVQNLKSILATWTLIYAQDELLAKRAAAACWRAGIMPVVRIGKLIDDNFDPVAYVDALTAVGAPPYVQIHNEPEDLREWRHGDRPADWARIFGRSWANHAAAVFDAGGYPGIQVLDRSGFDAAVDAVNAIGREDIWERAFFVHHNYGDNHPSAYPYDKRNQRDNPGHTILDDRISVLRFLAHAAWMQERIGFVLPIIGGEGGWLFGSENDHRYPKIEEDLHARYHAEMFEWMRHRLLPNGEVLPDYLFSITPWIAGSWTFGGQNWWNNILSPDGQLTKTIEAVQAIPPFVRRFSWDAQTTPAEPHEDTPGLPGETPAPPPEPPAPPPDQPPADALPLEWDARLDALGVSLERSPSSPAWRLVSAQYLDDTESDNKHNVFYTALDANGEPAAGVTFKLDWNGRRPDETPCITKTNAQGQADCPIFTMLHPDLKDGPSFATTVDQPGDVVRGVGLPNNHHVCFLLTYRFG